MMHQMKRYGIPGQDKAKYIKLLNPDEGKLVRKNIDSVLNTQFVAMVFNFVDILAHRRSDSQLIREIVPDESAYRSLTRTWFEHSSLFQIMKAASKAGMKIVLTSDHGSIRVSRGTTVYADRQTSTNLRYKYGRGIRGEPKHLFEMKEPKRFGLPASRINTNYLIAKEDFYFVYPTHYHHYLTLYRDSLQHGGISLEEMILPVVLLEERL